MIFIEASIFTDEIQRLLPDQEYRKIQWYLVFRPEAGKLIKGSGGLRKIRWNFAGSGKSGGLRIIYYFDKPATLYMLLPYKKNEQEDLTPKQIKILRNILEQWL